MRKLVLALIAVSMVFGLGCSKNDKQVATIGSEKISLATVESRINDTPPVYRSFLSTPAGKKQFLDLIIREKAIIASAKRAGLDNKKEYKDAIKQFDLDQKKRFDAYKDSLLMEMYIDVLRNSDLQVTDADIEKYFNENQNDYLKPVEITAEHILLNNEQDAKVALERLKKGEKFGTVASEMSTDVVSAQRGGKIGPFRKGDLLPDFEKAVYGLKLNETSGIVKTEFGYHIIRKISQKELPAKSKDQITMEIKRLLEKTKFDMWLESKKKSMGSKADYDALKDVNVITAPMQQEMAEQQATQAQQNNNASK